MSEFIDGRGNRVTMRRKLLAGVSVLALTTYASCDVSYAADTNRPIVWLEAGGQFDQLVVRESKWIPDFVSSPHGGPLAGHYSGYQRVPRFGFDADAGLNFQPQDSDWVFSASVHIGRARQAGRVEKHDNILPLFPYANYAKLNGLYGSFYSGTSRNNESHLFVDFQAGKDFGIGRADTIIRAGVRIAQMRSRSDFHVSTAFPYSYYGSAFNHVNSTVSRKFTGVGPSIAWEGSAPVAGALQDGQLAIDWSAGAALLFGRQTTQQKTEGTYSQGFYNFTRGRYVAYGQTANSSHARKKNVTVPNLGGSIGISYRLETARISLGYRADFFFNAIDGGIDSRKAENRGFFGPYASISIGVGD